MFPSLPELALLDKLFYLNKCNASVALRPFRTQNKVRKAKGSLSANALKVMVVKFEKNRLSDIESTARQRTKINSAG